MLWEKIQGRPYIHELRFVLVSINWQEGQKIEEDMRSIVDDTGAGEKDSLLLLVKRGKSTFYAVLEGQVRSAGAGCAL